MQDLPDGSYLSSLYETTYDRQHDRNGVTVRVIEDTMNDPGRPQAETVYRLVTTIPDPEAAPATELAALYGERWELETAPDELKTHQRGPRLVLRSKTSEGVLQEVYGYLLTHYAVPRPDARIGRDGRRGSRPALLPPIPAGRQAKHRWGSVTDASLSREGVP